jgi:hypothetical protein
MKPKRKKTANQRWGRRARRAGCSAGDGEADDRDRGEADDLAHREDRVADDLAGQQRLHGDGGDEQFDTRVCFSPRRTARSSSRRSVPP